MNYQDIRRQLLSAGIETASAEARILLEDVAGIGANDFLTKNIILSEGAQKKIGIVINRRIAGEPLWRILGYRDFWKSRFYLSADTLEPRPDTETLIEMAIAEKPPRTILDLGTGTGCILLSLLKEFPTAKGTGVDLSSGACATASENAQRLGLSGRTTILNGSWLDPLPVGSCFDLIVSNPPYIPTREIRNLEKNVQNHDPILALDGGDDGLAPYKILLLNLKKYLEPDGIVLFEFGAGQGDDLARIVEDAGATLIRIAKDLGGHERVMKITFGDN